MWVWLTPCSRTCRSVFILSSISNSIQFNSGSLVLVHNSAVLVPSGSFSAQELSAPEEPQSSVPYAAIVVPVVLGVILIAAVLVVLAVIVVRILRTC